MTNKEKLIVGSEEWCSLPSLGIPAVKARVDSGAKTSALHAFKIHPFTRGSESWVSFEMHPLQRNRSTSVRCEARVLDRRIVKSSTGGREKRYVIGTTVKIGDERFSIELTLTNRDTMGYRMLLGREAMSDRMLVDPSDNLRLGNVSTEKLIDMYGTSTDASDGLKIAVLASEPDLYSNKRLMEAGTKRGHEMVFLDIKHCQMKLDAETPEVHYQGGLILDDLDAVIPRIRPSMTFYGSALTRHFESLGVFSLNRSHAIASCRDKVYSLQLLQGSGLDIPTTGFANSPDGSDALVDMVGGAPLILKVLEGTEDHGVILATTRNEAQTLINGISVPHSNLLLQQYIEEAKGSDIRCFVIDSRVVAAIERRAAPSGANGRLHHRELGTRIKITPQERRLAVRAAKTMGLQVAGVDIIRSTKGPLLLEVNSSPALENIETVSGKDIAGKMIASVEKKLSWVATAP